MTICGKDCCKNCEKFGECGGCLSCNGHPFGGNCIAAEIIKLKGQGGFEEFKNTLIDEINNLGIQGIKVNDLNLLNGCFVNLEYPLENGGTVKYLNDSDIYLGNQIERENNDRCYGVVANNTFILVCEYGCNGQDPEIVLYKRR